MFLVRDVAVSSRATYDVPIQCVEKNSALYAFTCFASPHRRVVLCRLFCRKKGISLPSRCPGRLFAVKRYRQFRSLISLKMQVRTQSSPPKNRQGCGGDGQCVRARSHSAEKTRIQFSCVMAQSVDLDAALDFSILATDGRARATRVKLRHHDCRTPMFMPVGTQGTFFFFFCP